jgi:hypothetical protein
MPRPRPAVEEDIGYHFHRLIGWVMVGTEVVYRHRSGVVTRARPPLRICTRCRIPRVLRHFPLRGTLERCRFCRRIQPRDLRRRAARRLRDARAHWTPAQAARWIGISHSMYRELEGGSKPIPTRHWDRIDAMTRATRAEQRQGLATDRRRTW